ncbi:MAG: sodium-dependent transporter [Ruminococcaceae bacterium]|nr:sodium-dependent transporter [Oscillospiraceae bacterium]
MQNREKFSSRLGFILISAGCAIGLGNVWRFPFIVGQYGGAAFILIYLVFLAIFGLPIMTMEFAVGRASQKSPVKAFQAIEPQGTKWHKASPFMVAGNYLLMMFYTVVTGWMLNYVFKFATGTFKTGMTTEQVDGVFGGMLGSWPQLTFWMVIAVLIGFGVCSLGLKNGVEKITKVMMVALLAIMLFLAIRSLTLGGKAVEGLKFYLVPDFKKIKEAGIVEVLYAALGQSFFTLSIGIGSMAIFGSYISKERRLFGESVSICLLDTFVAFTAGLIIFPACFAYGVDPGEGAGLAFVTLPHIFIQMPGGRIIGTLFFMFLSFAALSTLIAVFENIISFAMDGLGWSRKKSVLINLGAMLVLSMPAVLGMNVLSWLPIPKGFGGSIDGVEDFIVSQNLLPLGSLVFLLFCTSKKGWGWNNFIAEADAGKGMKFPKFAKFYLKYILPVLIILVFIAGWLSKFGVLKF